MAEQTAIVDGQIVYIEEGGTAKPIMLPDGQILYVPAAAGGGGGFPKINGITTYSSINGVTTFTSINGVT